mmetsp:Transcript_5345/g.8267  ORF Transcript_5345/g.8267 Transcript_5345/m.8267 type:complete len:200 (+) Transcript_5345:246-845(+)
MLAAHLCGSRCDEVLNGETAFVKKLAGMGFQRFQVNATAVNGVDTSDLSSKVGTLVAAIKGVPNVEWIIQRNEETRPIWSELLAHKELENISILFDDSVGTGVERKDFPSPETVAGTPCGYAGGIGPHNIQTLLTTMQQQVGGIYLAGDYRAPWVDMESSLRSVSNDGVDSFSLSKVREVVSKVDQLVAENVVTIKKTT